MLAVLIVVVAGYMDLTGPAVEPYPFVAAETAQGETPTVEWRHVPVGLLPSFGDPFGPAVTPIVAGTPLVSSLIDSAPLAPSDWWAVSVDLPSGAVAGTEALLSLDDQIVAGVVVGVETADSFGGHRKGLVAVAPDHAAAVAAAVATGSVVVLIRP